MKEELQLLLFIVLALIIWLVFLRRQTGYINMHGSDIPYKGATIWEVFYNRVME